MNTTALIVTYNRLTKLKNCLKATLLLPFNHVIIIDNLSSDGTTQWLKTQTDPRLQVLTMKQNLGGAGGFKYGAHYISNHVKTDWIFFFDDDAYPTTDLLSQFEQMEKKSYQIFCSKVLLPSGKLCKMNVPYKKVPYTAYETFLYGMNPKKCLPNFKEQEEVETFSFVGAIVHHNILQCYAHKINEDLFIYFDDLLFSYHLTQLGYKILFSPKLLFIHDTDSHTNIYRNKKLYYLVRNLFFLQKEKYPPFSKPTIFFRLIYLLIFSIIKGKNIHSICYFFHGIKDGLLYKK